jgi:hypothetical protein
MTLYSVIAPLNFLEVKLLHLLNTALSSSVELHLAHFAEVHSHFALALLAWEIEVKLLEGLSPLWLNLLLMVVKVQRLLLNFKRCIVCYPNLANTHHSRKVAHMSLILMSH